MLIALLLSACDANQSTIESRLPTGVALSRTFQSVPVTLVDVTGKPCECAIQTVVLAKLPDGSMVAPILIAESPYFAEFDVVSKRLQWQDPVWAVGEGQPFIRLSTDLQAISLIILVRPLPVDDATWRWMEIAVTPKPLGQLVIPVRPQNIVETDGDIESLLELVDTTYRNREQYGED